MKSNHYGSISQKFFEESLEHLSKRSYIALWKIYEEMLHDPKIEEAVSHADAASLFG